MMTFSNLSRLLLYDKVKYCLSVKGPNSMSQDSLKENVPHETRKCLFSFFSSDQKGYQVHASGLTDERESHSIKKGLTQYKIPFFD